MLYNILRGKHPECGFTHITNTNKLEIGSYPNHASMRLVANIGVAQSIVNKKQESDWLIQRLNRFLEPFKGTITVEILAELKVDQIKPIYINAIEKAAQCTIKQYEKNSTVGEYYKMSKEAERDIDCTKNKCLGIFDECHLI